MERARGDLVKRVAAGVTGVALAASLVRCTTTQAREGAAREPTGVTAAEGAAASSTSTSAVAGSGASEESTALAPLEGELVRLPVAGFNDAIVSVPTGAKAPRPVVLALHGNFDRPEWQCEVWRGVTKARAFVVCPRGIPRPDAPRSLDRWTYGKGTAVRAEVEAALGAVRARFENYVASGPILYAGFSLGAIHGVGIVASDGQRYRRAVLVEGGHDGWTAERAKAYAAAGGERVLFACGQRACKTDAAQARKNLERAGIRTELVYGGEVGHTYDGPVASEIARVWTWLVADDPRWTDG